MPKRPKKENESKRNPRYTKVLPVDCRVVNIPPTASSKPLLAIGQDFAGRTINISEDGLLINSDFELDRDTIVDATIMTGTDSEPPIHARCRIAWARRNAFDLYGRWGMGLRILEIDPIDLDKLKQFFSGDPS